MTASTQPEPVAELVARAIEDARGWTGDPEAHRALDRAADALASMSSRLADAEAKVVELEGSLGAVADFVEMHWRGAGRPLHHDWIIRELQGWASDIDKNADERDAALALAETSRGKALEEAAKIDAGEIADKLLDRSGVERPRHSERGLIMRGIRDYIAALRSLAEASDRAPRDGETEQEERV